MSPRVMLIESMIREVCVFRSGALVRREAVLGGSAWPDEVCVAGLPLALEDDSVRVMLRGEGELPTPTDVRVVLTLPAPGEPLRSASQHALQEAERGVEQLRGKLARLDFELVRLGSLGFELPAPFEDEPPRPAPASTWLDTAAYVAAERRARLEEQLALAAELREAEQAAARLAAQQAQARARAEARVDAASKQVIVRLRGGGPVAKAALEIEYRVAGAKWAPTYILRAQRDGTSASLSLRALVVQRTGEPWLGVRLSVSTADLLREHALPLLPSLRLGRMRPAPAPLAWRAPPGGLDDLFAGFDLVGEAPRQPGRELPPLGVPAGGKRHIQAPRSARARGADRGAELARERSGAMLMSATMVMPPLAPSLARPAAPAPPDETELEVEEASRARSTKSRAASMQVECRDLDETGAALLMECADEPSPEHLGESRGAAEVVPRDLRYAELVMADWREPGRRGRLRAATLADTLAPGDRASADILGERALAAVQEADAVEFVALPSGVIEVDAGESFVYRYTAEAALDVPCDGRLHNVPLVTRSAPMSTTLIVLPRESLQATRVAVLENPLGAPLLAGPADVYLEDEFLVTAPLRAVPAGGELVLGLGVEEALKVARNAHYTEETSGLLRGGIALSHRVEIEVASRLHETVRVEVRERVPIKGAGDEDVTVEVTAAEPAWEPYEQAERSRIEGGKRWLFELVPGALRKLSFAYVVKVAGKRELVGGNRREQD